MTRASLVYSCQSTQLHIPWSHSPHRSSSTDKSILAYPGSSFSSSSSLSSSSSRSSTIVSQSSASNTSSKSSSNSSSSAQPTTSFDQSLIQLPATVDRSSQVTACKSGATSKSPKQSIIELNADNKAQMAELMKLRASYQECCKLSSFFLSWMIFKIPRRKKGTGELDPM